MKVTSVRLDDAGKPREVLAELSVIELARIYEALTHPYGHLSEMGAEVDGPIVGPIGDLLYRHWEEGAASIVEERSEARQAPPG